MCELATALTALKVASAVGGLYAQQQQQRATERYNQATYDNQMQTYRYNQANSNFTRVQEAENLAQQKVTNDAAARRARSTATVSAGESGIQGQSVDALLAELSGMSGKDNSNAETNYLRRDQSIQADAYNNWTTAANNINRLETPKAPDYLGAALKIGTAYNDYKNPKV